MIDFRIFTFGIIMPFVISMIISSILHPTLVKIAKMKNLVDNPDVRKLQKNPVPVLGGFAVYAGIVVGAGITSIFFSSYALFTCIVALTVMLYIGEADDIQGLKPSTRLIMEVAVIAFIVIMDKTNINDFHGLFGIHKLPVYISLPLCTIACTGIINAINMIDGVDGLSSSLCIVACLSFGVAFALSFDGTMAVMAALAGGALIPFFLHNVFGKESKMFIGDAGTLMMGTLLSIFCMHAIDNTSRITYNFPHIGIIAFCLSVLSVPVFDTLRVMTGRIWRGISPFQADKSHMHHLFLEIGFSHIGTAAMVVSLDILNILIWLLTWRLGGNATVQFIVVTAVGLFNTTGLHYIIRRMSHERRPYRLLRYMAIKSHAEVTPTFHKIREYMDTH